MVESVGDFELDLITFLLQIVHQPPQLGALLFEQSPTAQSFEKGKLQPHLDFPISIVLRQGVLSPIQGTRGGKVGGPYLVRSLQIQSHIGFPVVVARFGAQVGEPMPGDFFDLSALFSYVGFQFHKLDAAAESFGYHNLQHLFRGYV